MSMDGTAISSIVSLIDVFEPTVIYDQIANISLFFWKYVAIWVFILAAALRIQETSWEVLKGQGNWVSTLSDIFRSAIYLTLYSGVASLIILFYAGLTKSIFISSSFQSLSHFYVELIDKVKDIKSDTPILDFAVSAATMPVRSTAEAFFYATLLWAVVAYIFLRIGYAKTFVLTYSYGLYAFASRTYNPLNVMGGWTRSVVTIMLWPIIESILFFLLMTMLQRYQGNLLHGTPSNPMNITNAYLIFGVLNLIALGIFAFAPIVAIFMAKNDSIVLSAMAPWLAGAAVANRLMFSKVAQIASHITNPKTAEVDKMGNPVRWSDKFARAGHAANVRAGAAIGGAAGAGAAIVGSAIKSGWKKLSGSAQTTMPSGGGGGGSSGGNSPPPTSHGTPGGRGGGTAASSWNLGSRGGKSTKE